MTVHSSGVPQQLVLQSTLRSTAQNSPKTCECAATQLVLQSTLRSTAQTSPNTCECAVTQLVLQSTLLCAGIA